MHLRAERSHWAILSSIVLRSFSASTDSNSFVKPRARSSLSSPRLSCDDGSCFAIAFRSVVTTMAPAFGGMSSRSGLMI
ncbi:hypothetical protein BJV77DRAFT_1034671 [Russula vinacea]|nr:hypothetical protein BJV77DRAFT_1034671 [Russula vinacea]